MTPEQRQIVELQRQVKILVDFMRSFENPQSVAPNHAATIRKIVGAVNLNDLDDVVITSPSNGQVLEYLNGTWINATDNT